MKGLLIKDFKLMKGQRNFFLIIIAIAIGMAVFSDDTSFLLGFLPFVLSLFTLSTISYDEFDNGNAFLFTLPISRTGYTVEKYFLALLLGGGSWIFATTLTILSSVLRKTASISEVVTIAVLILPALLVIQAVMIPFQLKFGGEKGRLALIGAFGLLFIIGIVAAKTAELLGIDLSNLLNPMSTINPNAIAFILLIGAFILWLLSMKISISIIKAKEF